MKVALLISTILCMGCAHNHDAQSAAPDVISVQSPIIKASQMLDKARESIERSAAIVNKMPSSIAIDQLRIEIDQAKTQLSVTGQSLLEANGKITLLQVDMDKMRDWGISQQIRADRAEAKVVAYRKLKLIIATTFGIAAGLIATRWTPPGNPYWQIGAPVAVGAIAFSATYFLL